MRLLFNVAFLLNTQQNHYKDASDAAFVQAQEETRCNIYTEQEAIIFAERITFKVQMLLLKPSY